MTEKTEKQAKRTHVFGEAYYQKKRAELERELSKTAEGRRAKLEGELSEKFRYTRQAQNYELTFGTPEKPISDYENRIGAAQCCGDYGHFINYAYTRDWVYSKIADDKEIYLSCLENELKQRVSKEQYKSKLEKEIKDIEDELFEGRLLLTRELLERAIRGEPLSNKELKDKYGRDGGAGATTEKLILHLKRLNEIRPLPSEADKEYYIRRTEEILGGLYEKHNKFISEHKEIRKLPQLGREIKKTFEEITSYLPEKDESVQLENWFLRKELEKRSTPSGTISNCS